MLRSTRLYPSRYAMFFGLLLAVLLFQFQPAAYGQAITGSLSGTVADPSGAVIAHAQVVMKNEASGDIRQTTSNNQGFFSIAAVQPGTYTVTITSPGFKSWTQKGIVFGQGDNRTLPNINLAVGAESQAVEVTGDAALAPVDTGEVSTTLNNHMVTDIAIQGRNAGELVKLMPGMALTNGLVQGSSFSEHVVGTNSGPAGAFSANGTQPNGAMAYMLDGANLLDPGNEGTQIANINQDMTAEVKVLMSSYGAEYAKGPVIFQAFSKSGGAQFHGEGYLYTRNSVFNSEDSFQKNQGLAKPDESFYYPGGNIGGPVLIPFTHFNRNHDKLFFWVGYEYMKQQPAGSLTEFFVPTDEMKQGNFTPAYLNSLGSAVSSRYGQATAAPCPPTNTPGSCGGLVFPTGQIPASMFDPNALALLKLYPEPNIDPATHGGNNYEFLNNSPQNRWEITGKVDYNISENTKISVSYAHQPETDLHPITVWWAPQTALPYPSPIIAPTTANVVNVNGTHVFSPTLTNEAVFTYARYINPNTLQNPAAVDRSKIGFNVNGLFGTTAQQIPNILSWGGSLAGFYVPAFGGAFNGGSFGGLKSDPAIYDNLSKVAGTHTMKFGFYWDSNANQQSSGGYNQGTYEFENYGSTSTGNTIADLLIGHAQSYAQASAIPVDNMKYHQYSFYAQDSWKASRRLTLNYGIRFDHVGQWYDNFPGLQVFNQALYDNSANAPANTGLEWFAMNTKIPKSGFKSPMFYYEPRIGVAYDVFGNGKTVIRGGYAVFRYQLAFNSVQSAAESAYGVSNYTSNSLTSLAEAATLSPPQSSLNGSTIYPVAMNDGKTPYTRDWNFTISQAIPGHSVVEISYVGNHSGDLLLKGGNSKVNDLNVIPAGAYFQPDPKTGQIVYPWQSGFQGNDYFPLQNYQDIYVVGHGSYANYNSLQVSWQKQAGAVTFLANYTFGKVLGIRDGESDNGPSAGNLIDPFNLRNNYGVLAFDHTHIINTAYIWNLPKPIHGNPILAGAVNGWILSGTTQWQTGAPIQPNTGGTLNVQWPSGQNIPGLGTGVGVSNSAYLGTNAITLTPALTCDPRSGLKSGQYFNPGCFTVPAPGTNGSVVWPYIKGPAFFNSDLSIYKDFRITESQRVQVRFSAFNFLNHPNPQFGANGNGDLTLKFGGYAPGTLNNNTQTNGFPAYTVGNRVVEFALKYYF